MKQTLTVPERHQLRIARQTLNMKDASVNILGGVTKAEARDIIARLTGRRPPEDVAETKRYEAAAQFIVDTLNAPRE